MTSGAVVVAAGRAERMGFDKTLALLDGRPVLRHVLDQLLAVEALGEIVIVTSAANFDPIRAILDDSSLRRTVGLCLGGETRHESVARGVSALSGNVDVVLIHDAARPLATAELMCQGLRIASVSGAAIAAIPVRDTIKQVALNGTIERTPDRARLYAAQTPQVFRRDWLEESYRKLRASGAELAFSDEAGLLEWAGYHVSVFAGSPENIKLTYPIDLVVADAILRSRRGVAP